MLEDIKGQKKGKGQIGMSNSTEQQKMQGTKEKPLVQNMEYKDYVEQMTPKNNLAIQMMKAFLVGGIICVIGQVILNLCVAMEVDKELAGAYCSMILVLGSVVLTGLNIYPAIANFGGAGALVPITGFANSVAAPAIEYKVEGQVFGIGCKIFTIAGPVILYGIFSSWILGFLYWIFVAANGGA